ncbi:MAG: LysR family transcriptional regulator [Raoultibacter sp.]
MNERQEKYFLTIAEEGSISRAADRLFISRQALSGSINALEAELGTSLFRRSKSGISLTQEGELLKEYCLDKNALWGKFVDQIGFKELAPIKLGGQFAFASEFFLDQLMDLCEHYDHTKIEMHQWDNFNELIKHLKNGSLDLAYVYAEVEKEGLICHKIKERQAAIIFSQHSKLLQYDVIDFKNDLKNERIFIYSEDTLSILDSAVKKEKLDMVLAATNQKLLQKRVSSGEGVFILPETAAKALTDETITWRPLLNFPLKFGVYLLYPESLSQQTKAFVDYVTSHLSGEC